MKKIILREGWLLKRFPRERSIDRRSWKQLLERLAAGRTAAFQSGIFRSRYTMCSWITA